MTTITLDAIRTASHKSGISIADIIIGLDKALTQTEPKAPTIAKAADKADWRLNDASNAQIGRIERAEEAILATGRKRGIALILRGAKRDNALTTAGKASDYYKSLTAFTRKFDIRF